jgi:hypothetical protein
LRHLVGYRERHGSWLLGDGDAVDPQPSVGNLIGELGLALFHQRRVGLYGDATKSLGEVEAGVFAAVKADIDN